jgi:hypothetical protein
MRLRRRAAFVVALVAGAVPAPVASAADAPEIVRGLELGVALDSSVILDAPSLTSVMGYTARPYVGWELSNGFALLVGGSYSRWAAPAGPMWELSGRAGLRWSYALRRVLPWVEGALGYGQLVFANGPIIEIGLRTSVGVGLDFLALDDVRAGVHLGLEWIDSGSMPATRWLDAGFAVTFFLL